MTGRRAGHDCRNEFHDCVVVIEFNLVIRADRRYGLFFAKNSQLFHEEPQSVALARKKEE